jgi:hypothetical protein
VEPYLHPAILAFGDGALRLDARPVGAVALDLEPRVGNALPYQVVARLLGALERQRRALLLGEVARAAELRFEGGVGSLGGLAFSTFLGGADQDLGNSIAVDSAGNSFITGETFSPGFPVTVGSFDPSYNGAGDAFVVELNPPGMVMTYGGFLGSTGGDRGNGIALDTAGNAHVTGMTSSNTFPIAGPAFDPVFNGGTDAFVSRVAAGGGGPLLYSSYFGAPGRDIGFGIAVKNGDDYLVGVTDHAAFPIAGLSFDLTFNGTLDAFVARVAAAGPLAYSTFLGGAAEDTGFGIAVAPNTDVNVTGETRSNTFPLRAAADPTYNGGFDVFVTRF